MSTAIKTDTATNQIRDAQLRYLTAVDRLLEEAENARECRDELMKLVRQDANQETPR